jgi:alpha-tubulin suppressor-like RCC1 family protein
VHAGWKSTGTFEDAAPAGILDFGRDRCVQSDSPYLRKEEPTVVPATEGVRIRSVAISLTHGLALTDEGQVYRWGPEYSRAPEIPSHFNQLSEHTMRRVAAGAFHSAALTDEGKLHTWWDDDRERDERDDAGGTGYPLPEDVDEYEGIPCRPRCVDTLAGMRVVSVAAGYKCTIVVTDTGAAPHPVRLR